MNHACAFVRSMMVIVMGVLPMLVVLETSLSAAPDPTPTTVFAGCRKNPTAKNVVRIESKTPPTVGEVAMLLKSLSCTPVQIDDDVTARFGRPAVLDAPDAVSFVAAFELITAALAREKIAVDLGPTPGTLRLRVRRDR